VSAAAHKRRLLAPSCIAAALVGVGCQGPNRAPEASAWIRVEVPPGRVVHAGELSVDPPVASRVESTGTGLGIEVPEAAVERLNVAAPGACPSPVTLDESGARVVALKPWLRIPLTIAQAGYGKTVAIEVEPGCEAAEETPVEWTVAEGRPSTPVSVERRGHVVRVGLPPAAAVEPHSHGIVPISPRTQGRVVLRASFIDGRGSAVEALVTVTSAARATGLPNASPGQRLLLAGAGWHVTRPPDGGRSELAAGADGTWFRPDTAGVWKLEDASRRTLSLSVGSLDATPLDCTRADCHAHLAKAPPTPMTTVFERGLRGALGPEYDPYCALACHATGEPGLEDGGFTNTLDTFGMTLPRGDRAWERLPRALRRVGGVGCLACHGPAAIPEPSARWSILRSDVCATCHDMPLEYGHVAAWSGTRMARSDASTETRTDAECARCHTTSGFLHAIAKGPDRVAPADAAPIGISCAACHDVHEHEGGPHERAESSLLRDAQAPEWIASPSTSVALADRRARICIACHAPIPERLDADASAAALWAGRGGLEPESGEPLSGDAVHAEVDGGCTGCHHSGPRDLRRGQSHAFAVDRGRCAACHADRPADDTLNRRALGLLRAAGLEVGEKGRPPHTTKIALDTMDASRARALYDALLVLEDGAAAFHNAAYARQLLDAAERILGDRAKR
jgi:hypothetical protein